MINKILNKINQGQESDVKPYTWETTPEILKEFWHNYFTDESVWQI